MENFLLDGIIAWPTLVVNVFGGDYEVFQDRRGDGSRDYSDMIPMWKRVEYHPMPCDRAQVEAHAEGRRELAPT